MNMVCGPTYGMLAAGSASAESMNAETARRFVAGKLFAFNSSTVAHLEENVRAALIKLTADQIRQLDAAI